MKAKKVAFTGIPVTDIKRARAFYEGVLGLKVSGEFGEGVWIEYELGPDTIAIGSVGDQWKPSADGTSVAIEVEDFEAAIRGRKQPRLTSHQRGGARSGQLLEEEATRFALIAIVVVHGMHLLPHSNRQPANDGKIGRP